MKTSRYSTALLPPERRLDAWEERLAGTMGESRCRPFSPESLLITHSLVSTSASTIHALSLNAHMVDRTFTAERSGTGALFATVIVSGGATYYSTNSSYVAGPGDALVYDPEVPFLMAFQPGTREVVFQLERLSQVRLSQDRSCFFVAARVQAYAGFSPTMYEEIYHGIEAGNAASSSVRFDVDQALKAWDRILEPVGVSYAHEALRYIRRYALSESLRVEDIASHVGISQRHLIRTLGLWGTTVKAEITQTRISAAKELLAQSLLPITQIAIECGFGSASNFSRVFTKVEGLSPSQWRRQAQA